MTENEAISRIEDHMEIHRLKEPRAIYITVALSMAISALKEIQQYQEIGTVEECREAVEKQKPKKPRLNYKPKFFGKATYTCPRCGNCRLEEFANERQNNNYCWDCGQAIQWDANLEGMEDV